MNLKYHNLWFYMFMEKTTGDSSQDLKKRREELGLSLEDLFSKTRVRVVYLQAIENKEFDLLPVPVYAKNFIKIYAQALGVDSETVMKEYEGYLNAQKEQTQPAENVEVEKLSSGVSRKKTYLVIAFILIVVIVAQWLISRQHETASDVVNPAGISKNDVQENNGDNVNVSNSMTQQSNTTSVVDAKESSKPLPLEEKSFSSGNVTKDAVLSQKTVPQNFNAQNVNDQDAGLLVIRAVGETWLRVKADQNPSFQVLLKPGEKFEHKAKTFEIDIGNAGGIKIKFRGKDIETLGKGGEVVHLRLP